MVTGLIEELGKVKSIIRGSSSILLTISACVQIDRAAMSTAA